MAAMTVQGESGARETTELGIASTTLGKLQVPLPAAAPKERHKHVYSADAALNAAGVGDGSQHGGRCCVIVHSGSLLGLLPADHSAAPLWFAVPVSELTITTEGQKGAFKKRPASIILETDGFRLPLSDVDQLLLARGNYQAGRETELLAALRT